MKFNTIDDLIRFRSFTHPDRSAFSFKTKEYSYLELYLLKEKASAYLSGLGLKKGDKIAVLDFNSSEALFLFLGSMDLGIIPVYLNWRFTSEEIQFILKDAEVSYFFYHSDFTSSVLPISEEYRKLRIESFQSFLSDTDVVTKPVTKEKIFKNDIAIMLYTSGTTGYPKGVLLSHENLIEVICSLSLELPGFGADSANLVCAPFYHIGGVGYFLMGLFVGGKNILLPKFDPQTTVRVMTEKKVTNALLVPAMLQAITSLPEIDSYTFPNLRNIQYGGSHISQKTLWAAYRLFQCDFTQAYGLTETTGISCLLRFDEHRKIFKDLEEGKENSRLLSCGKPSPSMEMKIVKEDGSLCQTDELGEVYIRGEYVGQGYWKRSEDESFGSDGWFRSGDIGKLDADGFFYIVDRKKELIISKQENISPAEIERVYSHFPGVKDIAVVGIPDENLDEVIVCVIVKQDGFDFNLEELQTWGKKYLSGFKIPRRLYFKDSILRNPSGKILRKEIRNSIS